MTMRIENATRSLAYVSVERMMYKDPVGEKEGVKTYAFDCLRVSVTTYPQHPEENDVVTSVPLAPGESVAVDEDPGDPEFSFPKADPGYGAFGVELVRKGGDILFRLHPADTDDPPPLGKRH